MALILSITFPFKTFHTICWSWFYFWWRVRFQTPQPLGFSISSWWQPCQLSKSGVCLQKWLMSDGSQICARAQFPSMSVIEGDQIHTSWSLFFQSNTFCQHLPLPLHRSCTLHLSGLFIVLRHPINHSISRFSLCICTALGRRCLKAFSPTLLSDVIIWWRLRYFGACCSLFFVSLNTHNKQRVSSATMVIPFTLPSLRSLRDYTQTDGLSLSPAAAR